MTGKQAIALSILAIIFSVALYLMTTVQPAPDERLMFENPRIRLLPGNGPQGGFLFIHNTGGQPIKLLSAESQAFDRIMFHKTEVINGQAHMQAAGNSLLIPPNESLEFTPGGLHLMMMKPQHQKNIGDTVAVFFTWENATGEKHRGDVVFRLVGPGGL